MKVLRFAHHGRDAAHRERERALARAGAQITLVVPSRWGGAEDETALHDEAFEVVELPVVRPGDANRHRFRDGDALRRLVQRVRPDVVDLHEEPFSVVTRQVLAALPSTLPAISYTAQNLDKRFPPPFAQHERRALRRVRGIYPCSRQAASVAVGKGYSGEVSVLPLAPSPAITLGTQAPPTQHLQLLLVGRLVPHKGVLDAVEVLAGVRAAGVDAALTLVGSGPEGGRARSRADELGIGEHLRLHPWLDAGGLAAHYRAAHVVLAPSSATTTWVEQFGRMVVEARAAGAVVVGYASGSLPEVVGRSGVLVGEGDRSALTHAVRRLHDEPRHWAELRARGTVTAATETWAAVAAGQVDLYQRAASAPSGLLPVRPDRARARARFGPPARVHGAERPFAAPVLRRDSAATRALGRLIDVTQRHH